MQRILFTVKLSLISMFLLLALDNYAAAENGKIIGNIDGIIPSTDPYYQYYVSGWACVKGRPDNINVSLYLGDSPSTATQTGATYLAILPSEPQVAAACQSTGSTYRYWIPLSNATLQTSAGQSIYVRGTSADGAGSALLGNPGTYKVPVLKGGSRQGITIPQIWFTPKAQEPNGKGSITYADHDFAAMVASGPLWSQAASHPAVFDPGPTALMEAYPDVDSVIQMINAKKFNIIDSGSAVYTGGPNVCTVHHIEGVSNDLNEERELVLNLHYWKQHGGRLDYLGLDSPFYFGYYYIQNQCHFTIPDVAQRAATTVNKVLQDFPNAKIVDEEGPGANVPASWLPQLAEFITAFNAISKQPISYVAMDMHWIDTWKTGYNWIDATSQTAQYLHRRGIKVGLYMDADDNFVETSDFKVTSQPMTCPLWMQAVRNHMQTAHDVGMPLDFVFIASWMKFPARNLPETDMDYGFTSLVDTAYQIWGQ